MEYAEHIAAVEREAAAIVAALAATPLDTQVPSCPEWTVADLARHVGSFTVWTHVLCEGTGRPKPPFPDTPEGNALVGWVEELTGHLVSELRATPPDTTVWTWVTSDKSARFVARRAAHELAVHRFDAQLARGAPEPIDATLAIDGIDEIFLMRNDGEEAKPHLGSGETLHLHTAEGFERFIRLTPEGLVVSEEHAKADLALRGTASDVELVLFQRPPLGPVERLGDETVLDVWCREFTFA
ncbi:MAG: maleylpyruvate isomerase family mycothiol-dependent enzyme [Actinobacteria bacterium]|nr:maleylpyruvate isomerase family mycothiol-dependent enzyme [Actinomycetota bacterium]